MGKSYFSAILQAKDGTKAAFISVGNNASKAGRKVNKVFGKKGTATKGMKAFGGAVKVAGAAIAAMGVGTAIVLTKMGQSAIAAASNFEDLSARVQVMTGNLEETKSVMEGLVEFSNETPFELPEVADASIKLRAMGGIALSTKDNLRLVGDAAAFSGEAFNRMSFWVGRAFSEIQNRQALGEVQRRLIELGLGSNMVSQELETMRKAGHDTGEMWELFTSQFDRARGSMELAQKTFSGRASTLRQFVSNIFREVADQGLFESAKEVLNSLIEVTKVLKDSSAIKNFGGTLKTAFLEVSMITLGVLEKLTQFFQENNIAEMYQWASKVVTKGASFADFTKKVQKNLTTQGLARQATDIVIGWIESAGDRVAVSLFNQGIATEETVQRLIDKGILRNKEQMRLQKEQARLDLEVLGQYRLERANMAMLLAGRDTSTVKGTLDSTPEALVDVEQFEAYDPGEIFPFADVNSPQFLYFTMWKQHLSEMEPIINKVADASHNLAGAMEATTSGAKKASENAGKELKGIKLTTKAKWRQANDYAQIAATLVAGNEKEAKGIAAVQMLMELAQAWGMRYKNPEAARGHLMSAAMYGKVLGQSVSDSGGGGDSGDSFDPISSDQERTNTIIINNNFDQDGFQTSVEETTRDTIIDDFRMDGPIRGTFQGAF